MNKKKEWLYIIVFLFNFCCLKNSDTNNDYISAVFYYYYLFLFFPQNDGASIKFRVARELIENVIINNIKCYVIEHFKRLII